MIRIICLGKIKDDYIKSGINDYLTRLKKYHKVDIIECKDNINIDVETDEMCKYFDNRNFNIAMCIEGDIMDSMQFSNVIDHELMQYGNICFFVGSSNGLSQKLKDNCNLKLSFGRITLPHGLFRLVLIEQIYRSFKILNNETYHK